MRKRTGITVLTLSPLRQNLDGAAQTPKVKMGKSRKPSKDQTTTKPVPAPLSTWFSTKYAFLQAPAPDGQRGGDTTNAFDDKLRCEMTVLLSIAARD